MANFSRKNILLDIVAVLAVALIALIAYKLSPAISAPRDTTGTPEAGCNLQQKPCGARLADGRRVELSISPRPIKPITTLQLDVSLPGIDASQVDVDFAGIDMAMGLNRFPLSKASGGNFTGEGALPVCVSGKMRWRATVLIVTASERITLPFDFETVAN